MTDSDGRKWVYTDEHRDAKPKTSRVRPIIFLDNIYKLEHVNAIELNKISFISVRSILIEKKITYL